MKINSAENLSRSAKAPQMSAGVMIAKVIWKAEKTYSGMVGASATLIELPLMPAMKKCANEPMKAPGLFQSLFWKALE